MRLVFHLLIMLPSFKKSNEGSCTINQLIQVLKVPSIAAVKVIWAFESSWLLIEGFKGVRRDVELEWLVEVSSLIVCKVIYLKQDDTGFYLSCWRVRVKDTITVRKFIEA